MSQNVLPFKKQAALELHRLYRHSLAKSHTLSYFFWECTLRCNLNCLHCGSDCRCEADPDMPLADFLKVLDSVRPHVNPSRTLIVVTGGEPLMRKDLEEAGKAFMERGFPWGFVTNGFAMTLPRFKNLLSAGLRSMTVSLDGLNRSHDHFRGREHSFEKAVDTIRWASHTPGLLFDVVTCVNKENLPELPEIRDMLINLKLKRWRIATVFPKGRAKENPIFKLDDAEFKRVFDFIRETRLQGKIRADYGCEGFLGNYENQVRSNPFFCRAGINVGSVLADGSISACPSLRGDYIQGNIYRDDFMDVWRNRFQVMRDRSWTQKGDCATCKYWRYCEGGSLHLRDEKTGEIAYCHLKRFGIPTE